MITNSQIIIKIAHICFPKVFIRRTTNGVTLRIKDLITIREKETSLFDEVEVATILTYNSD